MVLLVAKSGQSVQASIDLSVLSNGSINTVFTSTHFGAGTKVEKYEFKYDTLEIYELGDRRLVDVVKRRFNGTVTISGYLSKLDLLTVMFPSITETDTTNHIYRMDYSSEKIPILDVNYKIAGGSSERIDYILPTRASLTIKSGDPIQLSIDGVYRSVNDTAGTVSGETETPPLTYAMVKEVKIGGKTVVSFTGNDPGSVDPGFAHSITCHTSLVYHTMLA